MTAASLWERLRAEGAVDGDYPPPDRAASPWFVRVMLGIAGWIGAGFLLGFVGVAFSFIMEDAAPALILGGLCCGAALALFRVFKDNDFVEQFALAISLAGQALIVIGLAQYFDADDPPLYFAIAAVEALLAMAVPNFLHRVLAAAGAAIALALGINQLAWHGLTAPILCAGLALVWLEPKKWTVGGSIWRPVGYGLVLSLLLVETFRLFGAERLFFGGAELPATWFALYGPLLGRAVTAFLLAWTAIVLALREGLAPGGRGFLAVAGAAILFGLLSLDAPGLASATLILLLGFAAANRILLALGVLGLLGFVSHYYYSLHATLLEKSGLMAVTGLLLLAAYALLRFLWPSSGVAEAGDA
jgi:hypothetical protein